MNLEKYIAATKEERKVAFLKLMNEYCEISDRFSEISDVIIDANNVVKQVYSAVYEKYSLERIQKIKNNLEKQTGKSYEYWEDLATLTYDEFAKEICV